MGQPGDEQEEEITQPHLHLDDYFFNALGGSLKCTYQPGAVGVCTWEEVCLHWLISSN